MGVIDDAGAGVRSRTSAGVAMMVRSVLAVLEKGRHGLLLRVKRRMQTVVTRRPCI